MGIVPIYDPENRKTTWVNTSAKSFRTFVEKEITMKKQRSSAFVNNGKRVIFTSKPEKISFRPSLNYSV